MAGRVSGERAGKCVILNADTFHRFGKNMENTERTYLFEQAPVPRAMAVMAIPTIMSQLITLIYNVADTWFIGLTNNPYMVAASSLVLTLYLFTVGIANLFGTGGGSLVSRLLGAGDEAEAGRVSAVSLQMAGAAALAYSAVCLLFREPILRFLGASDRTIGYASGYMLFVLILGGFPTVMSMTMANLLRSVGCSKQAGLGLGMGGLLNIILDPLFMFVILPDGMQVTGAAVATMLSNTAVTLYFIRVMKQTEQAQVLRFRTPGERPSAESMRSLFSVGVPAAVTLWLFDLCNVVINMHAAGHGDIELAAIGIVLKAERLPLNIGIGICLGMVPLVGYNYAAKNRKRMEDIFLFARITGLVTALVCVVLYRVFGAYIIRFFIRDGATVACGTEYIRARCFATPLMFLCFSMVHFFQAIGWGGVSFWLAVIRQLVFNIPLLFVMDHLFGMTGIVWTQALADLFTVAATYLIYWKIYRQGIRKKMTEDNSAPAA